jgi:plasmid stabilization system protein ParE
VASVRFSEEAEAEYVEALTWYHDRSARAAAGFEQAVAHAVNRIAESPEQFPVADVKGYRFVTLIRYPYSLVYRVKETAVQVVAVAHASRKPAYWRERTQE